MKNVLAVGLAAGLVMAGEGVNLSAAPRSVYLAFNGTNSAVVASQSTTLAEGSGPLTVSAWVKPAALGTSMLFVSKMSNTSLQWALGRDKTNHMFFTVMTSAGAIRAVTAASATNDLNWHHVAGVFDGSKLSLYVDAVSAATAVALSGTIASAHSSVCVGSSSNAATGLCSGGPFFKGSMDEVRIYRRALAQTEIQATKDVELVGNESGLALYYNFNDGAGPVAYDLAFGYHGILGSTLGPDSADPTWVGSGPDTTKPIAYVTFPTSGTAVAGQIVLTSLLIDNVGVVGVQYQVDGANFGSEVTTAPFSLTFDAVQLSAGSHTVAAIARDAAGNRSVANPVPFLIGPTPTKGCLNQNLGNGWTCIDSNAVSGNPPPVVSLRLSSGAAVPAHALILIFTDAEMTSGDGTMKCTDNAQNVFTRAPMGAAVIVNQANFVRQVSYWYVLDANPMASGYQASCAFTTTGVAADLDMSVMVFKQASGKASPGIDTYIPWAEGNSGPGPCPCEMVPGGQTLVVSQAGDLIIGGGNMNGYPMRIAAPFVGVDGDHYNPFPAYFTSAATSAAPGAFTFHWFESMAQNGMASTMFSFRPAP
jgi:hypothetical protein